MGDKTGIEWTDATWNPVRGCSKVSDGCKHCYAETVAARFSGPGQPYEGTITNGRWNGTIRAAMDHLQDPLHWRRPRRIFVNSMSDLFHEEIPAEVLGSIFHVMAEAKQHTFQVLTKRPERMVQWFNEPFANRFGSLPNVWLGVSVENQQAADERIPLLLQTPAAVRFLSCEPLLGAIDLSAWLPQVNSCQNTITDPDGKDAYRRMINAAARRIGPTIDWVIAGGESGSGARPMHPEWARKLRDQCYRAFVPFFFKQWGEWAPIDLPQYGIPVPARRDDDRLLDRNGGDDLARGTYRMRKIGKNAAGNVLDEMTWQEFPAGGAHV